MNLEQLKQILPTLKPSLAEAYFPMLQTAMQEFQINTPLREAAFIAQLAVESGELSRLTENLNYSPQRMMEIFGKYFPTLESTLAYKGKPQKIASRVYGGRYGNGDESTGDGYKYRGRGFIQLTFKDNYRAASRVLGHNLVENPDLAAQPNIAFRVAAWFFSTKGCNQLADEGKIVEIGHKINGGHNGKAERIKYYERALKVLGVK